MSEKSVGKEKKATPAISAIPAIQADLPSHPPTAKNDLPRPLPLNLMKTPQLPVVPENFSSHFSVMNENQISQERDLAKDLLPSHPQLASPYLSLIHHNSSSPPQSMQAPLSYPYFLPPFGYVFPPPLTSLPNTFLPPATNCSSPPQLSFPSAPGGYNLHPQQQQQMMMQYQHHLMQLHLMQLSEVRTQMPPVVEEPHQEPLHPTPRKAQSLFAPAPAQSLGASLSSYEGNSAEKNGGPESDEEHKDDDEDTSESDSKEASSDEINPKKKKKMMKKMKKKVEGAPPASNIETLWSQKRGDKEIPRKVKEKLEAFIVIGSEGLPRYNCPFPGCIRNYARSEHLGRHLRVHFNGKIYECKQCKRKFSRTDTLLQHHKVHQKGLREVMEVSYDPSAEDGKIGEIKTWLFKREGFMRSVGQQQ